MDLTTLDESLDEVDRFGVRTLMHSLPVAEDDSDISMRDVSMEAEDEDVEMRPVVHSEPVRPRTDAKTNENRRPRTQESVTENKPDQSRSSANSLIVRPSAIRNRSSDIKQPQALSQKPSQSPSDLSQAQPSLRMQLHQHQPPPGLHLKPVTFLLIVISAVLAVLGHTLYSDVQARRTTYIRELLADISLCTQQYLENNCRPGMRAPSLQQECVQWEKCMDQDPELAIGRLQVAAEVLAGSVDTFANTLGIKSYIGGLGVVVLLVVGYFVLSLY